jgi:hypothetical protein
MIEPFKAIFIGATSAIITGILGYTAKVFVKRYGLGVDELNKKLDIRSLKKQKEKLEKLQLRVKSAKAVTDTDKSHAVHYLLLLSITSIVFLFIVLAIISVMLGISTQNAQSLEEIKNSYNFISATSCGAFIAVFSIIFLDQKYRSSLKTLRMLAFLPTMEKRMETMQTKIAKYEKPDA